MRVSLIRSVQAEIPHIKCSVFAQIVTRAHSDFGIISSPGEDLRRENKQQEPSFERELLRANCDGVRRGKTLDAKNAVKDHSHDKDRFGQCGRKRKLVD